jgi:hypothetical protein
MDTTDAMIVNVAKVDRRVLMTVDGGMKERKEREKRGWSCQKSDLVEIVCGVCQRNPPRFLFLGRRRNKRIRRGETLKRV